MEMEKSRDIQSFIPESHRDLIEAVPRGFLREATTGALLLGALAGSLWTYILPHWLAATLLAVLIAAHLLFKHKSDRLFDERLAALEERSLGWETNETTPQDSGYDK
jgi:hypothetical protein